MNDLLIVMQCHTASNNPGQNVGQKRFASDDRSEITKRGLVSFIKSINYAIDHALGPLTIRLHIADDHSDKDTIDFIKSKLSVCSFETKFIALEEHGLLESLKFVYNHMRTEGKDLLYFAQDDYIYEETCVFEMIDSFFDFTRKSKKPVAVYPFDDPYKYTDVNIIPVHVVMGRNRHWRTQYGGSCAFMFSLQMLNDGWDLFEAFYRHKLDRNCEIDTINKLFSERGYVQISPIPSLAYHLQYDTELHPYPGWEKLWKENDIGTRHYYPNKTVLNVGSGASVVKDSFPGYNEVRMDIDPKVKPDLIEDIMNLQSFEDGSVDVVYASHVVEHLHIDDAKAVVEQMRRIVREKVEIWVPNLAVAGDLGDIIYECDVGPITKLDMIYGYTKWTKDNEYMKHKSGYTKKFAESLWPDAKVIEDDNHNLIIEFQKG